MKESEAYSGLQFAKDRLHKALEDIKKFDDALGGKYTRQDEVMPIVDEIFPE